MHFMGLRLFDRRPNGPGCTVGIWVDLEDSEEAGGKRLGRRGRGVLRVSLWPTYGGFERKIARYIMVQFKFNVFPLFLVLFLLFLFPWFDCLRDVLVLLKRNTPFLELVALGIFLTGSFSWVFFLFVGWVSCFVLALWGNLYVFSMIFSCHYCIFCCTRIFSFHCLFIVTPQHSNVVTIVPNGSIGFCLDDFGIAL